MSEIFNEVKPMNGLKRIPGIIFSPIKTLESIKIKPTLLWVMLTLCIVPVICMLLTWSNYETMMTLQLEQQMETMNVEVTQEMMDLQLTVSKVTLLVGSLVGLLISGIISATYYFVCAKITKSQVSYKQMLSLAYYVLVISLISSVLNVMIIWAGVEVNSSVPITSLASLLPSSLSGTFIFGIALVIEVFSIWSLVILYFGLRIVAQMSKKASLISIGIAFSFGALLSGGSMLLSSLLLNVRG